MANYFVSIIIPVYNSGETLQTCLEALFASSYPNFECIVVDDHSYDNSVSIAQLYGTRIIKLEKRHRQGYARNRGAEVAKGDILIFIDSDVKIYLDTIDKIVHVFMKDPDTSALFGSYDDQPRALNFISQYKNLFHHYIHQTSEGEPVTFWTGCGAIRKEAFAAIGGFNEAHVSASIEDIELGYRLYNAGYRTRLVKSLQVTHLKLWTLRGLLCSDICERAIPWTHLILRYRILPKSLNLRMSARLSTIAVFLALLTVSISLIWPHTLWALIVLIPFLMLLNAELYRFFKRKRGWRFSMRAMPLHWLYFLYSGLVFGLGLGWYFIQYMFQKDVRVQ